ncbi:MAG: hypothetical protein DCF19_22545 [Pseudanabaena frigida]|uniref:DUF3862 domain-containing protein n=1 Tax=Pseudanabaena frigida TaxID=945775 RepID=A0A2W4XXV2_9CYAN|nr:MAG: hypothetical protein DCF19_22545 [Pseudanabaena frigida]
MPNQSPKTPSTLLTVILIIIVLIISGIGILAAILIRSNNESEDRIAEEVRLAAFPAYCTGDIGFSKGGENRKKITMADYNQIRTGMSYGQVNKILGTESSCEEGKDKSVRAYSWRNSDGSYMRVTSNNNSVINKEQSGLK